MNHPSLVLNLQTLSYQPILGMNHCATAGHCSFEWHVWSPPRTHLWARLCSPASHRTAPEWRTPLRGSAAPPASAPERSRFAPAPTPKWRPMSRSYGPLPLAASPAPAELQEWGVYSSGPAGSPNLFRFSPDRSLPLFLLLLLLLLLLRRHLRRRRRRRHHHFLRYRPCCLWLQRPGCPQRTRDSPFLRPHRRRSRRHSLPPRSPWCSAASGSLPIAFSPGLKLSFSVRVD